MRIKLNKHGLYSERWNWTKKEIDLIEFKLHECDSNLLHVCSGISGIGNIRLDRVIVDPIKIGNVGYIEKRGSANILGNMLELPFKDASFETVICDPPYDYKWFENGIYQQMVNEIVRVTRKNGKILFYAPTVFTHKSLKLISTDYTQMGQRCYYKILSVSEKTQHQLTDYT